jgi:hypothetical protein
LFVHQYGQKVVAFDVTTGGDSFRFGVPQELMTVDAIDSNGIPFDVHPDGKRIVHAGPDPKSNLDDISPIHLVTDWRRALAR